MKVFISWSGQLSRTVGEAIRDWLPNVLQLVTPYFTPSDVEKGTRFLNEIAAVLEDSQVGILCLTRDNLDSHWILFEAGALSKSLDQAYVCPVLFGITNTDLAGPLKQFQTTQFDKKDFRKLIASINDRLGENQLPPKTFDAVFEKWWPDLDEKIRTTLSATMGPQEPVRSDRELLEEVLQLCRVSSRPVKPIISLDAVHQLLSGYIALHDEQVEQLGGYQETLDGLKRLRPAVHYLASKHRGISDSLDQLIRTLSQLSFRVTPRDEPEDANDDAAF